MEPLNDNQQTTVLTKFPDILTTSQIQNLKLLVTEAVAKRNANSSDIRTTSILTEKEQRRETYIASYIYICIYSTFKTIFDLSEVVGQSGPSQFRLHEVLGDIRVGKYFVKILFSSNSVSYQPPLNVVSIFITNEKVDIHNNQVHNSSGEPFSHKPLHSGTSTEVLSSRTFERLQSIVRLWPNASAMLTKNLGVDFGLANRTIYSGLQFSG